MNLVPVNEAGLAALETNSLFVPEGYLPDKGSASFLLAIPSTVSGPTQLRGEAQRFPCFNPHKGSVNVCLKDLCTSSLRPPRLESQS